VPPPKPAAASDTLKIHPAAEPAAGATAKVDAPAPASSVAPGQGTGAKFNLKKEEAPAPKPAETPAPAEAAAPASAGKIVTTPIQPSRKEKTKAKEPEVVKATLKKEKKVEEEIPLPIIRDEEELGAFPSLCALVASLAVIAAIARLVMDLMKQVQL
jgi:hypothetical protein